MHKKYILLMIALTCSVIRAGSPGDKPDDDIRDRLLLSENINISAAEYVLVEGKVKNGWIKYVYFSFTSKSSPQELLRSSKILRYVDIDEVHLASILSEYFFAPKLAPSITKPNPGIGFSFYRKPSVEYLYLAFLKADKADEFRYVAICDFTQLPTNGSIPRLLLNEKGENIKIDQIYTPLEPN